jgi:hypothetical protein
MTCPYFVADTIFLWVSGLAGVAGLIWFRD